jgi:hypothetical protein
MTREERTESIIADLRSLWRHMDREHPIEGASDAAAMARAGLDLMREAPEGSLTLGDAMSQAVLLLTMVRETLVEHDRKVASAQTGI